MVPNVANRREAAVDATTIGALFYCFYILVRMDAFLMMSINIQVINCIPFGSCYSCYTVFIFVQYSHIHIEGNDSLYEAIFWWILKSARNFCCLMVPSVLHISFWKRFMSLLLNSNISFITSIYLSCLGVIVDTV